MNSLEHWWKVKFSRMKNWLRTDKVINYEEAIPVVKEHDAIIRSKKKSVLNLAN